MINDFSKHHIVPRSQGGMNTKNNLVRLTHRYHVAFHQVFMNQTPDQQIERILDISSTALTDEFKEKILQVLNETEMIYKNGILVRKHIS